MSIVLKENEWAAEMIASSSLGNKPSETLKRVARYYMDKGFSVSETRRRMDAFLLRCDPMVSLPKWSDTLNFAVTCAGKREAVDIDCICITDKEIERINSLDGKQIKRLAFTLLCLAKYWKAVSPSGDYWVNNRDNEIMQLANIKTSIKRQSLMYWELREAGLVQFSRKVDNTNVKVCFVEEGRTVMKITDFRNLGYQYLMYVGEPYFQCECCCVITKIFSFGAGRKQKYCQDCSIKIHMKQKIESVMRVRHGSGNLQLNC